MTREQLALIGFAIAVALIVGAFVMRVENWRGISMNIHNLPAIRSTTGGTKPRVRIVARGNWIRNDGAGFPFDPSSTCQIIFDDGGLADTRVLPADYWPEQMWKRIFADHRYNIAFYRFTPRPSVRDMPLTELPA